MELNDENYHGLEARKEYMGSSQFKDFLKCEYDALKKVNGEVNEEKTTALLVGSYIDAYFSGELDIFEKQNPEIFNKNGTLKSDYENAKKIVEFAEEDEKFIKYLGGQKQVIMTGVIAGVKYKIKIDSYFPGKAIVDGKVMKDCNPVWIEKNGRNVRVNFVEAYRYDIQGAIYQEIERQWALEHGYGDGSKLPFILAVLTKEKVPDKRLLQIDQEDLDAALDLVKDLSPRFDAIKKGDIEPIKCGKCDSCKRDYKVTGIFSYHTVDPDFNPEDD